jgi:DNA-binding NtrC family response regulator
MRATDRVLRLVADKDVVVALIGESGSGKEVLARRVHELSHRRRGPFVPINCAAIPDALFESELFGHERGAFTGANERVRGKIEAAQGGTLFLDEIGEMVLPMQAKLLRFLENRRFMRVGGATKLEADVRLVVATLRPLEDEVRAGRFRADLLYRIQGITIPVPPLRERRADIAPLLAHFTAERAAYHGVRPPRFTREAKRAILAYAWPGNVRELKNVVESLCLLRAGKPVRLRDLPLAMHRPPALGAPARGAAPTRLDALVEGAVARALAAAGGMPGPAAAELGVSVRTLQRWIASGRVRAEPTAKPRAQKRKTGPTNAPISGRTPR